MAEEIERLNYFQRQYLGAEDFKAEQAYHRDMRRRHNLAHHTWGIVIGLDLLEQPADGTGGVDVYVMPGLAIDGYGREIIVSQPHKLSEADFDAFNTLKHLEVWIAYSEEHAQRPAFGYEVCDVVDQFARVRETFRIVIEPKPPSRDDIFVAGKKATVPPPVNPGDLTIPADESVPYQELPDDSNDPRWLIRLGKVNWDGVNKQFVPAAAGLLNEKRSYIGVVAEKVYAPSALLHLLPRTAAADPDAADFASVEGRLRVDGRIVAKKDIFLHGGKLSFQDTAGSDDNAPLWMQRQSDGTNKDLRIHIGGTPSDKTRLTIGPTDGGKEKPVLTVRGDDKVEILTGTLDFGSKTRQMINLWSTADGKHQYGIGVQAATTYFRSHNQFCWFKDGEHVDAMSEPGGGGSLQLRLDDQARLFFGAQVRQMLNLWKDEYGIGIQSGTLYFRTASDFCWFRGGTHSDAQADAGGGSLAMRINNQNNLFIHGDVTTDGDLLVGNNNSRVVKTRHVNGKQAANNGDDKLFLNWRTGRNVVIGEMSGITSDLEVSGDLIVRGNVQSVFKVHTEVKAIKNGGQDTPGNWSINYAGQFSQVYAVFAVLQGFSIFTYEGQTQFNPLNTNHYLDVKGIPQHVFVRVDGHDNNQAHGVAYCAQANVAEEENNTVLFTIVVMGRSVA